MFPNFTPTKVHSIYSSLSNCMQYLCSRLYCSEWRSLKLEKSWSFISSFDYWEMQQTLQSMELLQALPRSNTPSFIILFLNFTSTKFTPFTVVWVTTVLVQQTLLFRMKQSEVGKLLVLSWVSSFGYWEMQQTLQSMELLEALPRSNTPSFILFPNLTPTKVHSIYSSLSNCSTCAAGVVLYCSEWSSLKLENFNSWSLQEYVALIIKRCNKPF